MNEKQIDGLWIANGFKAEFRVIRTVDDDIYYVETAAGESYANKNELFFGQTLDNTKRERSRNERSKDEKETSIITN